MKYALITNDVESTSIIRNELSYKTAELVFYEGMPKLLNLYRKYNIKATFFFTGEIIELFPDIVKLVIPDNHEIGSHGYSHDINQAFDILSYEEQCEHLKKSKYLLEKISNDEVISFRAPALRVNKYTPKALIKSGFKIDSSVSSQRFDFFLTFGSLRKLKWFLAPRKPYFTSENSLFKVGNSTLLEIPISALIIPYIGTTLRIFPTITRILRTILVFENKLTGKPINFLTHPNEFIDEKQKRIFKKRTYNIFSYIFADRIRYYLKQRNLGTNGLSIFENELRYLSKSGFKFITLREFRKLMLEGDKHV